MAPPVQHLTSPAKVGKGQSEDSVCLPHRPVVDLCHGGRVRVAFNQYDLDLEVDTGANKMVSKSITYSTAWPSEILTTFFDEHQLTPTFIDGNYPGDMVRI